MITGSLELITLNTEGASKIMLFTEKALKKDKIIFSKAYTVTEKK
jgi:hypothetical protein